MKKFKSLSRKHSTSTISTNQSEKSTQTDPMMTFTVNMMVKQDNYDDIAKLLDQYT